MPIDEELAKQLLQKKTEAINAQNRANGQESNVVDEEEVLKSLGKSQMIQSKIERREETRNMAGDIGWKNIPVENLPSEGKFYVEGTQILIRAASVQEIRHFSTIEEQDVIDIDDKLNFILEKCTRINTPTGILSFKDILEIDRFSLIFAIREYTFKDGENKLQMTINCNQCGHSDLIEIGKNNFNIFKMDEKIQRFYSSDEKSFILNTKGGERIELFVPTLGVTNWIKNLVRTKRQKNEYFDTAFLKIAPFLFPNWRAMSERQYKLVNDDSFQWSVKKMSIVVGIIDLLQESINPNILHTCTSCGTEVASPINFQGGIKGLFLYTDIFDELV